MRGKFKLKLKQPTADIHGDINTIKKVPNAFDNVMSTSTEKEIQPICERVLDKGKYIDIQCILSDECVVDASHMN